MKSILLLLLTVPLLCAGQDRPFLKVEEGLVIGSWSHPLDTIGKPDTVKVVMLVSDTAHRFAEYTKIVSCEEVGCKDTADQKGLYHSHLKTIKHDRWNGGSGPVMWVYGYSVREFNGFINGNKSEYSFYTPYPVYRHIKYLDSEKKPLRPSIIVWNAVLANK